jgi:hypothetical protein
MDKEQARFILRSFRPDGADATDPDFAAALHLAAEDRELGEWLARERAQDAAFSAAVARTEIPESLRQEILFGLAAERGEVPPPHDELDRAFIAALAEVHPPEHLHAEILAALPPNKVVKGPFPWFRFALPLAAAAGLALAFLTHNGRELPSQAKFTKVPVEAIQAGFIKTFKATDFSLEKQNPDHEALFAHLKERDLPCPDCNPIPAGLLNVPSLGCRELVIDGKRGSLICFNLGADGIVHLIMFRREDVSSEVPVDGKPHFDESGGWAAASWGTADSVFVLVGDIKADQLAALF